MARLPQNIDVLTLIAQVEAITAQGQTPVFQMRRLPFHGGGHPAKVGACQTHLLAVSGVRRPYEAGFDDYVRVLQRLNEPWAETRLISAVPAGTKGSKRCPQCPYKVTP